MKDVFVYGDYGYVNETLLAEGFHSIDEAVHWVQDYHQQHGMNGANVIEVATFADDGEYITYWRMTNDTDMRR